ncbi:MAG: hypothetical protein Q4A28_08265 [Brachymonas sp.]|nr:hypothetical protein [Brachymonas sp.]
MFSRLLIIGFLLCLPIVIALFSQQITRTVEPPKLPATEQEVRLLSASRSNRSRAEAFGHEVSEGYTLRTIEHWAGGSESDAMEAQAGERPSSQGGVRQSGQAEQGSAAAASVESAAPSGAQRSPAQATRIKRNKR